MVPENVFFIETSFYEIKQKLQSLYDFEISLYSPYDLCDYKVTYGELFGDYLKDYDFWGYCDCDLVFGNIRKFITDDVLKNYDKILIRGHFTLFRNTFKINTLYRSQISDGSTPYKYCFTDKGIHHFDEGMPDLLPGINRIFKDNIGWDRVYDRYLFMDLCVSRFDFINSDFVNNFEEQQTSEHSFFLWDNGSLYRVYRDRNNKIQKQEFMYIHFQKREMKLNFAPQEKYYIIPNRFLQMNREGEVMRLLRSANKRRFYWDYNYKRLKRKIKKILGVK